MSNDEANRDEQIIRAYRVVFLSPPGQIVLTDLSPFCQPVAIIHKPGDPVDVPVTFMRMGRYEVIDRIRKHTQLSDDDLFKLRHGYVRPKVAAED